MINVIKQEYAVSREHRAELYGHKPAVVWFTGLSGAGKSTIAAALEARLHSMGCRTYALDGDNVRLGLNKDLGFSENDRKENIRRVAEAARLFADSGAIVTAAFISPYENDRKHAMDIVGECFIEIHVSAKLEDCEKRDPKGLYKKARNGEIKNFTGIDSPYEVPTRPDLVLDTSIKSVNECVDVIMACLYRRQIIGGTWKSNNHGGRPTSNPGKKRAVFIGRFQPYHEGHAGLVRQKLDKGIPALIMVRDVIPDEKNPFTAAESADMMRKYYRSKGQDVQVMVIPDIESVNYGRGVGYEINEFTPPDGIAAISATRIRDCIRTGDDSWKEMVDKSLHAVLTNKLSKDVK